MNKSNYAESPRLLSAAVEARDCLRAEIAPMLERLIAAGGDSATVRDLVRLRDLAAGQAVSLLQALKNRPNTARKPRYEPPWRVGEPEAGRYLEPRRKRLQVGNWPEETRKEKTQ
jgi:hypothetical protein